MIRVVIHEKLSLGIRSPDLLQCHNSPRDADVIACEQALHVGLARDLFFWEVYFGRERRAAARGLGRERARESSPYDPAPILSRPLLSPAPIFPPPLAPKINLA